MLYSQRIIQIITDYNEVDKIMGKFLLSMYKMNTYDPMSLDESEVFAALIIASLPSSSTERVRRSLMYFTASLQANR